MKLKQLSKCLLVVLALSMAASCDRVREEVIQSYPSGKKMLVMLVKGSKKDPTRVGEKMYYESGELQFEKIFSGKPEIPDGIWTYYWDNGQLFASGDFTQNHEYGKHWEFFNRNGESYYPGKLDSVYVSDLGMFGTPATVVFCSGKHRDIIQFYSNYTVRSTERLTDDKREGKIYFYFPNGAVQVEANFEGGLEEGPYIVYRENGIPYYQGKCHEGKRIGIWEFYDEQGNLLNTKDYGE